MSTEPCSTCKHCEGLFGSAQAARCVFFASAKLPWWVDDFSVPESRDVLKADAECAAWEPREP